MPRINPFRPNRPVNPASFVGRQREVERIDAHLLQARAGNPGGFLVTGERGIGKTSLLLHARAAAEGRAAADRACRRLSFLVVSTDIDPSTSQVGLARKVELGLGRALEQHERALAALRRTWGFLQRFQAAGLALKARDLEPSLPAETLVEELASSLAATTNAVTSPRLSADWGLGRVHDGVLLLLDEADAASDSLRLGSFLKLLAERVQREGCDRLLLGLAGTPRVRDVLARSHESSPRLFDEIELGPLDADEVGQVLDIGLLEAEQANGRRTTVTDDGRRALAHLSEGHPHFIQQFAHSAFERDADDRIDVDDVVDGALGPGGAIDLLGNRLYREIYWRRLEDEGLRAVLRAMAARGRRSVGRVTLSSELGVGEEQVDAALARLVELGIVVREAHGAGAARLASRGLGLWIRLFGKDHAAVRADALALGPRGGDGAEDH